MKPIRTFTGALAAAACALLLALGAAACGTSDDPLADLPGPPESRTTTGPAGVKGAAGAGKAKGGRGDAGDDDDDDSPKGGDGSDGGGGGGSRRGRRGGGDDDDDSGGDGGPPEPRGSGVVATRTISSSPGDELTFDVSGLVAPPSKLTLIMRNRSSIEHGIAIAGDNVKSESDSVDPGETARVTVELPAGEYEFYCPVEGHQESGMSGTLSIGILSPSAR